MIPVTMRRLQHSKVGPNEMKPNEMEREMNVGLLRLSPTVRHGF